MPSSEGKLRITVWWAVRHIRDKDLDLAEIGHSARRRADPFVLDLHSVVSGFHWRTKRALLEWWWDRHNLGSMLSPRLLRE
jgi:hypothetical protein